MIWWTRSVGNSRRPDHLAVHLLRLHHHLLRLHNEGHAILTVATETGDYILDNRTDEIRGWRQTEYRFLKRQSQADPLQWVALVKDVVSETRISAKGGNR